MLTSEPGPPGAPGSGEPLAPYDGILLLSFGGPESEPEVMPFLHRVTGGRVPPERLEEVATHYYARGGRSPINDENRRLIAALERELAARGSALPVLWGNRHADPDIAAVLTQARDRGYRRLLVLLTSAYPSYSSCRVYREELAAGLTQTGSGDVLSLDVLPPYALTPAFLDPMARLTRAGIEAVAGRVGIATDQVCVMFVTHSIPDPMNEASGPTDVPGAYVAVHERVCAAVLARARAALGAVPRHRLVYCSRSGRPSDPWLEPDINDALEEAAEQGVRAVVVVPIGFVSDHMEVVYDLDEQAAQTAQRLGIAMERVPTVRDDPQFVAGVVDLMVGRAGRQRERVAAGGAPAACCPDGCCANPRGPVPAVAQAAAGSDDVLDHLSGLRDRADDTDDGDAGDSHAGDSHAGDSHADEDPDGLTGEDLEQLEAVAAEIAAAAGLLIMSERPERLAVSTKSSRSDVVTEMDQAAETFLRARLAALRPDDAILGEEGGVAGGRSDITWVLDPIDGTVNYLYGLGDYAVSVAAVLGDPRVSGAWRPVAGAVAHPERSVVYSASRGGGAWVRPVDADGALSGPAQALTPTAVASLDLTLLGTGFGYRADVRRHQARLLLDILPAVRDIRRAGSAALDLCAVAAGRLDAYYERGVNAWDFAAGWLIVTEAGGVVSGISDDGPGDLGVVAAAPGVHAALRDLLRGVPGIEASREEPAAGGDRPDRD